MESSSYKAGFVLHTQVMIWYMIIYFIFKNMFIKYITKVTENVQVFLGLELGKSGFDPLNRVECGFGVGCLKLSCDLVDFCGCHGCQVFLFTVKSESHDDLFINHIVLKVLNRKSKTCPKKNYGKTLIC